MEFSESRDLISSGSKILDINVVSIRIGWVKQ